MITKEEYNQGVESLNSMLENGEISISDFIRFHELLELELNSHDANYVNELINN